MFIKIRRVLLIIFFFFILLYSFVWFWVATRVNLDTKKKSDTIIVLGARINLRPGVINPCLLGRVNRGVELYQQGFAKKIIFSGGVDREDGTVEAEAMKNMAISQGVSAANILTEATSDSTYQNLLNSQQVMKQNQLQTSLIVTEPFHTPRASLIAQKLKMNYSVSPANSSCWSDWKYLSRFLWREPFALIKYFFQGRI